MYSLKNLNILRNTCIHYIFMRKNVLGIVTFNFFKNIHYKDKNMATVTTQLLIIHKSFHFFYLSPTKF